jgi:hypothetical protein
MKIQMGSSIEQLPCRSSIIKRSCKDLDKDEAGVLQSAAEPRQTPDERRAIQGAVEWRSAMSGGCVE